MDDEAKAPLGDTGGPPPATHHGMIDHLVYASPDLARGVSEIEALTGVRASAGGKHVEWGTHNFIAALGTDTYLEIIAPDPSQTGPVGPRPFGIDGLGKSRLVSWAVRSDHLESVLQIAELHEMHLGEILSGRRVRSDGVVLTWRLTSPWALLEGGLVPFFIDWGFSPHPGASAALGLSLVELRAEHPDPQHLERRLIALGVSAPVVQASHRALVAIVDCPKGRVALR